MKLCDYKDIFGRPSSGLHSYRIPFVNLAFIDVFFTLIASYILHVYSIKNYSVLEIFIFLFIIGEIFHLSFCVKTPITDLFV